MTSSQQGDKYEEPTDVPIMREVAKNLPVPSRTQKPTLVPKAHEGAGAPEIRSHAEPHRTGKHDKNTVPKSGGGNIHPQDGTNRLKGQGTEPGEGPTSNSTYGEWGGKTPLRVTTSPA